IKVFFDIRIPNNENTKLFESKVKNILIKGKDDEGETVDMTKLRIEYVKAFPIRGYHPEKLTYLRIVTNTKKQRSIALNIILKHNSEIGGTHKLETASDDMRAYYQKVAREYRIPLSRWDYKYNSNGMPYSARSPLCEHAFYVSINNYCSMENPSILYK
ncbi:12324_t:CDS:1, partial [Dentiscutata erythropus]